MALAANDLLPRSDASRTSSRVCRRPSLGVDRKWRCRAVRAAVDPTATDQISAIKPYNHEAEQQLKANGRDHEQTHCGDFRRVVSQKGLLIPDLKARVA